MELKKAAMKWKAASNSNCKVGFARQRSFSGYRGSKSTLFQVEHRLTCFQLVSYSKNIVVQKKNEFPVFHYEERNCQELPASSRDPKRLFKTTGIVLACKLSNPTKKSVYGYNAGEDEKELG